VEIVLATGSDILVNVLLDVVHVVSHGLSLYYTVFTCLFVVVVIIV